MNINCNFIINNKVREKDSLSSIMEINIMGNFKMENSKILYENLNF